MGPLVVRLVSELCSWLCQPLVMGTKEEATAMNQAVTSSSPARLAVIRALYLWTTPVFRHQGLYLNIIRALYLWTTPVFRHQGLYLNIIRALYLWTTPVFLHQGLYLDVISITSSERCTCGQRQYSNIRAYTCGRQYSIIRSYTCEHHQYNIISALYM